MPHWIAVILLALPVACAPSAAKPIAGDGELVIEVGGGGKSLAASLRALGVELLPPRPEPPLAVPEPKTEDAVPPADASSPRGAVPGDAAGGNGAKDVPRGGDEPTSAGWFEVVLEPRQTLMDLAQQHLGTARRFKEILDLNGWSDKDARRLKVGQKVKIPRATATKSSTSTGGPAAPPAAK